MGKSRKKGRCESIMSIEAIAEVLVFLVGYCAPAGLVINLSSWAVNALIGAVTGKGLKL